MSGRRGRSAKGPRQARACPLRLLLSGIAGCRHKEPPAPAPVATAPPITPSSITVITPLPSVPPQPSADVKPAPAPAPAPPPAPTPVVRKRHIRHKPPATNTASTAGTAPANPENAGTGSAASPTAAAGTAAAAGSAAGAPPQAGTAATPGGADASKSDPAAGAAATQLTASTEAAPALGQLSTGTSISSRERTRMLREIQVQETRLGKQKEASTADARTLEMQAQTFLQKARQAVEENDLDGAQTLTTKARVLLDELESE